MLGADLRALVYYGSLCFRSPAECVSRRYELAHIR